MINRWSCTSGCCLSTPHDPVKIITLTIGPRTHIYLEVTSCCVEKKPKSLHVLKHPYVLQDLYIMSKETIIFKMGATCFPSLMYLQIITKHGTLCN